MRKYLLFEKPARTVVLTGILLLSVFISATAQEMIQVSGTITARDNNMSLPGANVLLQGTSNGTVTDVDGKFTISVPSNSKLVFSFIGYLTQEIDVGGRTTINVTLETDLTTLEEVVVVGYGVVKRSDVTGSVVSLKKDELTPGANINVQQSLQGRVAGVQVIQRTGEPGSTMDVRVRGVSSIAAGNDPLYVIDGMPVNNTAPVGSSGVAGIANNPNVRSPMNSINPADIESIEVLKDASATAIYGARGSNGVILITTKKGNSGGLKVSYNVQYGISKRSNKLDLLSGEEYRDVLNEIIDAGGGVAGERVTNEVVNVDWQEELSQTGTLRTHDLNFSGGKDNTKYYVSFGFFGQEGVIKASGSDRYSLRVNLENSVPQKYAFGVNINASYMHDKFNAVGTGVNENGGALYSAIYYDPTYPVYDADGNFNRSPFFPTTIDHPLAMIDGQYSNSDNYRTFASMYGEYFLMKGLSAKVRVAGDFNTTRRNSWVDPTTIIGRGTGGTAQINGGTVNYYMGEGTLNFNRDFGSDHAISAVLGTTYEHFGSESYFIRGQGYTAPDLTYDAIGSGNTALNAIGSGRQSAVIVSFLGRVNYTLKNKYLLTASFRADGSSRFGPNNRFGYFPSVAVAWKIHEEGFLSGSTFIDELKLRASYGSIGNQNIANYIYFATYGAVSSGPVFNGTRATLFQPTRLANPDLKWEAANQADLGVDFSFFERRLSGSLEYYLRNTSDLLLDLPKPLSTGFGSQTVNIGSMRNSGIDLTLNGEIIRNNNFSWNLGTVVSTVRNRVTSLGPLQQIFVGGVGFIANPGIIKVGESIASYYGYKVVGVWQTDDDFTGWSTAIRPGDLKFEDLDGNNVIDANDRQILGKPLPDFTYGITNTFKYKNATLSVFFEGAQGGSLLNAVAVDSYFPVSFRRNRLADPYLNRWTPENPSNEYPSFINPTSQGQQLVNSKTVEDASYLRLQSIQFNYNFNLKKGPFSSIQAFVTAQNLFTITPYTGIDPAVSSTGADYIKIDYSAYPMTRNLLFGLNFQL